VRRSVIPAALAMVLVLAGCGSDDGSETEAQGSVGFSASGEFGDDPEITFPSDDPSDELEVEVASEGDGDEVQAGDMLVADYKGQVWDGDVFDSSFDRDAPTTFGIGVNQVIEGWDEGLVGQNIGSRVLLSVPSEKGYAEGNPSAGIEQGDTIVFVVDIRDAYATDSTGEADAEVVEGAADELGVTIKGDLGEPVTVEIDDDADAPSKPETILLAEGSGDPLEPGETALQFAIGVWDDQDGASTWDDEQIAMMTLGDGTTPFDQLLGEPIGSRAAIQVPKTEEAEAMTIIVDIIGQPSR